MTEKILDSGVRLSKKEAKRLAELEPDFLVLGFPGFFGVVENMLKRDTKPVEQVKEIQDVLQN